MNNWVSEFQFSLWTAGEGTVCQKSSGWQEEVLGADLELNKKGAWTIILWELIIFVGSGLNARSFWIMIAQRNLIICISFTSKRKDIHVLLLKPFADVKIISRGEHLATYASFCKKILRMAHLFTLLFTFTQTHSILKIFIFPYQIIGYHMSGFCPRYHDQKPTWQLSTRSLVPV